MSDETYAPGTVVEATVEVAGRVERRRFFRTRYLPNPWVAEQDVKDRAYYSADDFSDVTVLYVPLDAPLGSAQTADRP